MRCRTGPFTTNLGAKARRQLGRICGRRDIVLVLAVGLVLAFRPGRAVAVAPHIGERLAAYIGPWRLVHFSKSLQNRGGELVFRSTDCSQE
jgi:hypothetical protein